MNERDAYRAFHRRDRLMRRWKMELRRIRLEVESLELDLAEAVVRDRAATAAADEATTRRLVDALFNDEAFNRVLRAFTGHTPHGWEVACGCDGRMRKLLKDPGWGILREVIRRVRAAKGWAG